MALKDILGQNRALEMLKGCIVKNRLAHAYLFAGESGIGKRLTAVNFAKTLNCRETVHSSPRPRSAKRGRQLTVDSEEKKLHITHHEIDCCDKCPSCIKIDKAIHPDVFFIQPEGDGGQIRIEIIRVLEEALSYKAYEGRWKIAIIDEAENLNQSAANAFLKTLEEPPEHSILILISSMPELIPETIRSRRQSINFSPLPINMMVELLIQNSPASLREAGRAKLNDLREPALLSMLSCGRPGRALSEDLIDKRNCLLDRFKSLLGMGDINAWDDRDSMEEWFEWVHLWLRDIAVFKATNSSGLLINYDKESEIKKKKKNAALKDILVLSDKLNNIKSLLRFNLNEKITLNYTSLLLKETFG
ncbi:MAG: DNA polymerase III subunit [Nitrospirae bacterium]|nr:DNA polymerase III subunit [Nitrospirota bacterium]